MLRDEVESSMIPKHMDLHRTKARVGKELKKSIKCKLLNQYLSYPPSHTTVLRWVLLMGFKRGAAKNLVMLMVMRSQNSNNRDP